LLVALGHWLLSPAPAHATCGDYVMIAGHATHHGEAGSMDSGIAKSAGTDDAASAPIHHGRCSGPQCSGGSPRPIAPPAAPVTVITTDWGVLAAPFAAPPFEPQFADLDSEPVHLLPGTSAIYRPPR